jgi:hypothetical protein
MNFTIGKGFLKREKFILSLNAYIDIDWIIKVD